MNLLEAHDKTWKLSIEFAKNCTVRKDNSRFKVSGIRVTAKHKEEIVSILIIPVMEGGVDNGIVDVFVEDHIIECDPDDTDYVQHLCDKIIDHMDTVMQFCEEIPNKDFMEIMNQDPEVFN